MSRIASAPSERAASTCTGSTMKSLQSTGASTTARTAARSSKEPLNRSGSVSTEIAEAHGA